MNITRRTVERTCYETKCPSATNGSVWNEGKQWLVRAIDFGTTRTTQNPRLTIGITNEPPTLPQPASEPWKPRSSDVSQVYLENARMILAAMWRKKMEAMKESERTRTMNGSLWSIQTSAMICGMRPRRKKGWKEHVHSESW